jgi:methionyl-tRNA formyltransferase
VRPRSLVYLGTPDLSVPPLRALHGAGFEIRLVVTKPDVRRGRGSGTAPSPVKAAAVELGLPVSHAVDDVLDAGADLGVVVAFGRIIRPHVLDALPMVNLHFSLLPRWRGAAPVERAILAGDGRTGVDLMVVEAGLDTGAVHARTELDIGPDETAAELRGRLVEAGTQLLVGSLLAGLGEPVPQVGEPVYARKLSADDLRIDWDAPAEQIHRQVRVGGAWTTLDGERFKVWRTSIAPVEGGVVHPTGTAPIELLEVQPAGKARMAAAAWANGARWSDGDRLGS